MDEAERVGMHRAGRGEGRSEYRAALFDMDGTLVDSTATVEQVWTEFATAHGLDAAEVLTGAHGTRAADTMARFLPEAEIGEAVRRLEDREIALVARTVEIPGAARYLERLRSRGVPTAVVTSASAPLARARLLAAGLPLPDVLVSAADVAAGKPAPDGYRLAADRLDVEPARSVVFEDAEAGIGSGLAAGAVVVVVGRWRSAATDGLMRIRDFQQMVEDPELDLFTREP